MARQQVVGVGKEPRVCRARAIEDGIEELYAAIRNLDFFVRELLEGPGEPTPAVPGAVSPPAPRSIAVLVESVPLFLAEEAKQVREVTERLRAIFL